MKKFIIIILFIAFKLNASAQPPLRYDTCHFLQQYEGEWMQASGQDTIRINFRFFRDSMSKFNFVSDKLYGWYECKHGSTVASSTYNMRFRPLSYDYESPSAHHPRINLSYTSSVCGDKLLLGGSVLQLEPGRVTDVRVKIDPSKNKMYWSGEPGIFPENMVLIKQ